MTDGLPGEGLPSEELPRGASARDDVAADGGSGSCGAVDGGAGNPETLPDADVVELMSDDKREFLLEAVRRAPLLEYLGRQSASAAEILEEVDTSRSTVHRALDTLAEYEVIERWDDEYQLTQLGEILLEELDGFGTRVWTAHEMTHFLNSVDMDGNEIPVEYLSDATVTRREPRQPHATIHRIMELFERSGHVRMFSTVISPIYVDMAYPKMMNGMEIQAIFEREVVDLMLQEFPRKAYDTMATGNFEVYAHGNLPFELFLFDDRVGMAAHNGRGNAEVLVECDDPAAISWAEELYDRHLAESDAVSISDV